MIFELITIALTLAFVALILWAVNKWMPGPLWIRYLFNVIVAIAVVFWLLSLIGYHYPGTHG